MRSRRERLMEAVGNALQLKHQKRNTPFAELDTITQCSILAEKNHMSYGEFMAWSTAKYGSPKAYMRKQGLLPPKRKGDAM